MKKTLSIVLSLLFMGIFSPAFANTIKWSMPGDSLTTTLSHMTASIISPPTASIRNLRVEFEKHYKDGNGVQSRDVRMLYGYSASLSSDEVLTIPSMYTSSAVVRMRVCADIEEPPGDYEHTTSVWVIKGGGSNTHASAQFNDLNSDWSSGITKWFYLQAQRCIFCGRDSDWG